MSGYEVGDFIICRENNLQKGRLTINKKYCILESTTSRVVIFDDFNKKRKFHWSRFGSELDIVLSVIKKEIYLSSKT